MYQSYLSGEELPMIKHFFEYKNGYDNRTKYTIRSMIDAILYIVKNCYQRRISPVNFAP
jgi:hypothetical protein